jgi:hypothetical protein
MAIGLGIEENIGRCRWGDEHEEGNRGKNISYSSFHDWCYGKTWSRDLGLKGVLIPEEEEELV